MDLQSLSLLTSTFCIRCSACHFNENVSCSKSEKRGIDKVKLVVIGVHDLHFEVFLWPKLTILIQFAEFFGMIVVLCNATKSSDGGHGESPCTWLI